MRAGTLQAFDDFSVGPAFRQSRWSQGSLQILACNPLAKDSKATSGRVNRPSTQKHDCLGNFQWVAKQPATELFTTSITEAEILYGIELLTRGKRRQELLRAAGEMFNEDLGGRVLGFGSEAAGSFAQIAAHRRALGKPISHADAEIAAIARVTGAKLATRNVADFADCGIDLVNPWNEGSR